MIDITERLRTFEGSDALGDGDFAICVEGADEIERLRAALKFYADAGDYKAPLTAVMGSKLWSDCGTVARKALNV